MYIPILGAFFEASGVILQKKALLRHKINTKNFIVYTFLTIILVMLPLLYFFWEVKPEAIKPINLLIFFSIVLISILANLFTFYSLKREDVTEIEPIRLIQPFFTLLLAFIFSFFFDIYYIERNPSIFILGLIASIALISAHIEKNHLVYNKYIIAALIGSFLFSLELVISKSIISHYSTFTFYFLRSLFIFLIAFLIFHPKVTSIKNKTKFIILAVGIIAVLYRMILYYGYISLGIVFTTMIFLLAPVLIYIFARIFLGEKIYLRQIISATIIIICVIATIILSN